MTEVAPIPNDNTKLSGLTFILKVPWISLKDSDAPDTLTKSLFDKLCGDCVNASILPKESGKNSVLSNDVLVAEIDTTFLPSILLISALAPDPDVCVLSKTNLSPILKLSPLLTILIDSTVPTEVFVISSDWFFIFDELYM